MAQLRSKHKRENIVFVGSAAIWSVAAAEHHVIGEKRCHLTEKRRADHCHMRKSREMDTDHSSHISL